MNYSIIFSIILSVLFSSELSDFNRKISTQDFQFLNGVKTSLYIDNSDIDRLDRDPIEILLNNSDSLEYTKGDTLVFEIIFPEGVTSALFTVGLDQNGNNQLDDGVDYLFLPNTLLLMVHFSLIY